MSDARFYQVIREYIAQDPEKLFKLGNEGGGCDTSGHYVCNE